MAEQTWFFQIEFRYWHWLMTDHILQRHHITKSAVVRQELGLTDKPALDKIAEAIRDTLQGNYLAAKASILALINEPASDEKLEGDTSAALCTVWALLKQGGYEKASAMFSTIEYLKRETRFTTPMEKKLHEFCTREFSKAKFKETGLPSARAFGAGKEPPTFRLLESNVRVAINAIK